MELVALKRILVVIPYFGKWPFWMPFFLEGCRCNSTIDWLLFSDCGTPAGCPPNVRVEHVSFTDYCRLVSNRLKIDFRPSSPYKLCDLKPALGYVHADKLTNYDFWAFGDIDVIYGDLRDYFKDDRLSRYDLLSTHTRRVSGHFCLLRNNARMREAFMSARGWQEAFSQPEHCGFDEGKFSRLFIRHKNWPEAFRRIADLGNFWRRHSEFSEAFSTPHGRIPWTDGSFNFPNRWFWREGCLTNDLDNSRTFPYFHFIGWKVHEWSKCDPARLVRSKDLIAKGAWSVSVDGFDKDS
jgi:hypothetical protein